MIRAYHLLLASTAILCLPTSAFAQATQADTLQEGAGSQEKQGGIVVTGTRASVNRGIQIKKAATQIIDTVSASEIGQLPDFNAGDALRRVTGVNTLMYQGEPRFVIVRGLNQGYNDILVDGFGLASTDINIGSSTTNGRQISMEVLPANLASHIDVIKSALPETEGNFIGGLVNFATPSAFDFAKPTLSASVRGGMALQDKGDGGNHFGGEAQITGATRFGSDHQFGAYVSATYWRREINVPQEESGSTRYFFNNNGTQAAAYGGNGYGVPAGRVYYNYQNKRQRFGIQGRLDWEVSDKVSAYLTGYNFYQQEDSDRWTTNAALQSSTRAGNQTATSATITNVQQTQQLGQYLWKRKVYGVYGRFKADLGNGWAADFGASWSHSSVNNPQISDTYVQSGLSFNYDTSNDAPIFTAVNPTLANDYSRYSTTARTTQQYLLSSDRYDVQANIGHNVGKDDMGFGVKAGFRFAATRQAVSLYQVDYTRLPYTLADVAKGPGLCGYQCDTPIPAIDPALEDQFFNQYKSAGATTVNASSNNGGTYSLSEDIWAGYLQGQYRADRLLVIAGVRLEGTNFSSSSTQATNAVYAPISANSSYFNALPSLSVIFDTSSSSKLRFGASMSVGRPPFSAQALHGGALNTTANPPTLSRGNPDLKARQAKNLDLSWETYFDHNKGMFAIAGFYKWIKNEIYSFGQLETIDGVSQPVFTTQMRNTDGMTRTYGLELTASHELGFLGKPFEGFGISANATFTRAYFPITLSDGSVQVRDNLAAQPGHMYNASLYYDKGKVHGRIAWNHLGNLWDDRYPNLTPTGYYANRIQQATDNVDLQMSYDVTRNVSVSFDAQNLTAQGMAYRNGYSQEFLQSAWKIPTQILFGLKVKL